MLSSSPRAKRISVTLGARDMMRFGVSAKADVTDNKRLKMTIGSIFRYSIKEFLEEGFGVLYIDHTEDNRGRR
jgi:hypothetical protein